jgi:hypothetical protein
MIDFEKAQAKSLLEVIYHLPEGAVAVRFENNLIPTVVFMHAH